MWLRIAGDDRTRSRAGAAAAPPARPRRARRRFGLRTALVLVLTGSFAEAAAADPASPDPAEPVAVETALVSTTAPRTLDELFVVPAIDRGPTAAERTDASLAEAVARRDGVRNVATTGFRKKSIDLFSHERAVAVGEQEMLLRLRLRAKTRETMSVELRF